MSVEFHGQFRASVVNLSVSSKKDGQGPSLMRKNTGVQLEVAGSDEIY